MWWPGTTLVTRARPDSDSSQMPVNRAILILGLLLLLGSLWLVLSLPPGSGEFVVSLISLVTGAVLIAIAMILARRSIRRALDKEDQ